MDCLRNKLPKAWKNTAGIHRSLKPLDVMKRTKHEVAEVLRMKVVIFVSNRVQALSDRVDHYLTISNLLAVLVPGGSLEAAPGEAIDTSMLTALEPKAFRHEVRERVRCEGAGKDPDEMDGILDEVNENIVQHEAIETANKAAAGRNGRRRKDKPPAKEGGGQLVSSSAPANARGVFRASLW